VAVFLAGAFFAAFFTAVFFAAFFGAAFFTAFLVVFFAAGLAADFDAGLAADLDAVFLVAILAYILPSNNLVLLCSTITGFTQPKPVKNEEIKLLFQLYFQIPRTSGQAKEGILHTVDQQSCARTA
jgi:hypothetical protein